MSEQAPPGSQQKQFIIRPGQRKPYVTVTPRLSHADGNILFDLKSTFAEMFSDSLV
jgi:hypothetical protein